MKQTKEMLTFKLQRGTTRDMSLIAIDAILVPKDVTQRAKDTSLGVKDLTLTIKNASLKAKIYFIQ